MQPLDTARLMMVLELVECRIEGTQRVTEEAVAGIDRRRPRIHIDIMGARVVRDDRRTACGIVAAIRMWSCDTAGSETCDEEERDAATVNPRRSAKHHIQLSYWQWTRQQLADSRHRRNLTKPIQNDSRLLASWPCE
jgi:hypothetical protein